MLHEGVTGSIITRIGVYGERRYRRQVGLMRKVFEISKIEKKGWEKQPRVHVWEQEGVYKRYISSFTESGWRKVDA